MKRIRIICLGITFVALFVNVQIIRAADTARCCPEFEAFCEGLCMDSGGVLMTDCNVWPSCQEVCICDNNAIYGEPQQFCSDPCIPS